MNKTWLFLLLFTSSFSTFSQSLKENSITEITSENVYSSQNKGWEIIELNGRKFLLNLSHNEYVLFFFINCSQENQKPFFLIEFSDNYRDGNYGGVDFTNSNEDRFAKITVFIDNKEITYPFETMDKTLLSEFVNEIKKGKILTFKFFDSNMNNDTNKENITLNRELSFELENSELLDQKVDCK